LSRPASTLDSDPVATIPNPRRFPLPNPDLNRRPLVEAILEIRWELQQSGSGHGVDPHYRLLLGRLFDRVMSEFPHHEPLPSSALPDEMLGQTVQHRFRSGPGGWPLVQVGPGVVSLNSTDDYSWSTYSPRAVKLVQRLFEAHPKVAELRVEAIVLRYINAFTLGEMNKAVLDFVREKLKIQYCPPNALFAETGVDGNPLGFACSATFRTTNPPGVVDLRLALGKKLDEPALICELTVRSMGKDVPSLPNGFGDWAEAAHGLINDWFFKLIDGELLRSFQEE
jgi:uncharacterized protein (TIGR04255 family)